MAESPLQAPEDQGAQPSLLPAPPPEPPFIQRIPPIPFAIFSLALIFFLYQVIGGVLTVLAFTGSDGNVNAFRWGTLAGQVLFILIPTILLARLRYPGTPGFFQLRVPDYKEVILSVVAVFALQQLLEGYMMLQGTIPLPGPAQDIIDKFRKMLEEMYKLLVVAHSPGEFIVVVLVVALTPAICEELFFRGLIQRSFEQNTIGLRGALITGLIFALYHLNPFTLVPLCILGSYFGFLVYRSRNLTVAMSAHFFNNFVACAAMYMQLEDDFLVIAPGGNVTTSLVLLNVGVSGLVFVAATYYFIRVTEPTVHPPDGRV